MKITITHIMRKYHRCLIFRRVLKTIVRNHDRGVRLDLDMHQDRVRFLRNWKLIHHLH